MVVACVAVAAAAACSAAAEVDGELLLDVLLRATCDSLGVAAVVGAAVEGVRELLVAVGVAEVVGVVGAAMLAWAVACVEGCVRATALDAASTVGFA